MSEMLFTNGTETKTAEELQIYKKEKVDGTWRILFNSEKEPQLFLVTSPGHYEKTSHFSEHFPGWSLVEEKPTVSKMESVECEHEWKYHDHKTRWCSKCDEDQWYENGIWVSRTKVIQKAVSSKTEPTEQSSNPEQLDKIAALEKQISELTKRLESIDANTHTVLSEMTKTMESMAQRLDTLETCKHYIPEFTEEEKKKFWEHGMKWAKDAGTLSGMIAALDDNDKPEPEKSCNKIEPEPEKLPWQKQLPEFPCIFVVRSNPNDISEHAIIKMQYEKHPEQDTKYLMITDIDDEELFAINFCDDDEFLVLQKLESEE